MDKNSYSALDDLQIDTSEKESGGFNITTVLIILFVLIIVVLAYVYFNKKKEESPKEKVELSDESPINITESEDASLPHKDKKSKTDNKPKKDKSKPKKVTINEDANEYFPDNAKEEGSVEEEANGANSEEEFANVDF